LDLLWETSDYSTAAGAAIASDQEHLYMGDRRCDGPELTNCDLFLVVLDLNTGNLLGEVQVLGSVPTLGEIFIGENEVYYIASEPGKDIGYVTRISIVPEPPSLLLLLMLSMLIFPYYGCRSVAVRWVPLCGCQLTLPQV
jgi:hypothetical protein